MDDTGLQNKTQGNKLTDDDQKQIDDALNKLPDMPGSSSTPKVGKKTDNVKPAEPVSPVLGSPTTATPAPAASSATDDLKTTPVTPVTPIIDKAYAGGLPPLPPIPPVTPPADKPDIAEEKPEINKPPSKLKQGLKKNGKKIAGGMLVLALIAGGIFGVNLTRKTTVEEKQVVESEASAAGGCSVVTAKDCAPNGKKLPCKGTLSGNANRSYVDIGKEKGCEYCGWSWSGGQCCAGKNRLCKKLGSKKCTTTPTVWECQSSSFACDSDGIWMPIKYYSTKDEICKDKDCKKADFCKEEKHTVCNTTTFACEQVNGAGTNECTTNEDCAEETHLECNETTFACEVVAGAGTDTCADDPDCAQPSLSCVDLASNPTSIAIDDTVTFTCEGSFSSIAAPVAYFRHSIDGGTAVVDPLAYPIDLVTNTASADILVDEYGDWSVECRVCEDNTAASCTAWGQAN